jgi:FkbM family methyltransferase
VIDMLSTSQKVSIARVLSRVALSVRQLCGAPSTTIVRRGGALWSLDLKEGIDLSIYLLGGFEPRTLRRYKELIADGFVVLDIGANVGAHTLPLAQLVGPSGRVIAFEPTEYAFDKLLKNVSLNPGLSGRISANQTLLGRSTNDELPGAIYSSWPLENASDLHSDHQGRLKSTSGADVQTVDRYVERCGLDRLDFIKLDVDGHEYEVLQGARATLERFRPGIVLELAPYVYSEKPAEFDGLLELLWDRGYLLTDLSTGASLPRDPEKVRRLIPPLGGMNSLARVE